MSTPAPDAPASRPRFPGLRRFGRRYAADRVAMAGAVVLAVIVGLSLLAPWIAPYPAEQLDPANRLDGPSLGHLLGTDSLGRDTFSRLLHAGRVSLSAATLAVSIAIVIGVPLGLLAGYSGGVVDWVLGRAADALMAFPAVILAISIVAILGPGLGNAMVAIGVAYSPRLFRITRGASLAVRGETYVEASISIGSSPASIIARRVVPNILAPLFVQISLMFVAALLAEAALSLLGIGVVPPTPSWGSMLGRGFAEIRTSPILVVVPGLTIAIVTLAFNVIGDGLRDSLGREIRRGDDR